MASGLHHLTEITARVQANIDFYAGFPAAAGKSRGGGRITPVEWERRTGLRLRFVHRRSGPSLLVAEGRLNKAGSAVASRSETGRGLTTGPIFLLVALGQAVETAGSRPWHRAGT